MFCLFCVLLVVQSCCAGGSHGIKRAPCYGGNSTTDWSDMGIEPSRLTMFFTPSRPGSQRVQVSESGVVLDPHYMFSDGAFTIRSVTERDDGVFSAFLNGVMTDVLTLLIRDCTLREVDAIYGDSYNFSLGQAHTLEFTPRLFWDEPPLLLWNRTGNPQAAGGRRGRLVDNTWAIERVTQEHSGYYTLRHSNNQRLPFRRKLTVKARHLYFHKPHGEDVTFTLDMDPAELELVYIPARRRILAGGPKGNSNSTSTVYEWEWVFGGRISISTGSRRLQVSITDVQPCDAGVLEVRDQQGNRALWVELDVPNGSDYCDDSDKIYLGVGVAVGVLLVLLLCCVCVRRHRNKSRKTNSGPLTEAADVSFSDDPAQPSTSAHPSSSGGLRYSAPLLLPKEPGSPDYTPPLAGTSSAASHEPASTAAASSNAGAQFELKGATFSSAPPDCDVYTSDKLNFPSCPAEPQSTVYQPLAPDPVESSSMSGLPVYIHPTTHF